MNDEKTAADHKVNLGKEMTTFLSKIFYKILFTLSKVSGGSVLHLVLALRGGQF